MSLSLDNPLLIALITLVTVGAMKWALKTIIDSITNARRVKVRFCPKCHEPVRFDLPLPRPRLPTRNDFTNLTTAAARAVTAVQNEDVPGYLQAGQDLGDSLAALGRPSPPPPVPPLPVLLPPPHNHSSPPPLPFDAPAIPFDRHR